jgi:DNA-directed RNA polymerase specialized sigma24 family protein
MTESILHLDPEMVIAELDSLARAILVLRGVLGASVRDCSLQLNVSCESVQSVERRVTTWLTTVRKKQLLVLQRPA